MKMYAMVKKTIYTIINKMIAVWNMQEAEEVYMNALEIV
jgi:hypothetical protein